MTDHPKALDRLLHDLRERAKELNCLYEVQELLNRPGEPMDEICEGIIRVLPPGWQYPDVCQAEIVYAGRHYRSAGFRESDWRQSADIVVQEETVGVISVYYTEERPLSDEGPFLKEERRLINTIAEQLGFYILHGQLRRVFQEQLQTEGSRKSEWAVLLDLLKRTDADLLMRITRKMVNYLSWSRIKEADHLLEAFIPRDHPQQHPEVEPRRSGPLPGQRPRQSKFDAGRDRIGHRTIPVADGAGNRPGAFA
jgi:hypothetical protein